VITAVDLFSCIGSQALGLRRAGIQTIAFCEINAWRRDLLAREYPGVPIYDDVRTFDGVKATIVIGGPPCQNTSVASAIHGKRTEQTLWPEMLRIGINVAAEWIVVEQPPGLSSWEAKVADDLSANGWHCSRIEFAARDVGAPYRRRRVFVIACTDLQRLEIAWRSVPRALACVKRAANARNDWCADKLATIPVDARSAGEEDQSATRRQWIEALGDSNPPHMTEVVGRAIVSAIKEQKERTQ
jgi:site-specific DNA-cytosine methylase